MSFRSPNITGPLLAGSLAALVFSCATPTVEPTATGHASTAGLVSPPLELSGTAYEAAADVVLPNVPAGNYPGLHNIFRLSDNFISGSEPLDDEALAQVAAWGVKTILSVDGKAPAVDKARELGMRYVHVPLQYKGITDEQIAQITKTFHELEPPFFVHCFHGKHRGPTAAALGRIALDGLSRDRAIAEMRQWSSTAQKYEGLYNSVATADIPTRLQSSVYDFDFTEAHRFDGFREVMIGMTRLQDELKIVRATDWSANADHPDVDPLRSATQMAQLFAAASDMKETEAHGEDFHEMMADGKSGIDELVKLLTDCRQAESAEVTPQFEAMEAAYQRMANSCLDCHTGYRN